MLAAKEGMRLVGKPVMGLGKTGRSFGERQISTIIEMAERQEFDVLILWVWSRFGRNMKDSLTNLDRLTELGIEVRAVKEDFDGRTNIGRFAIRQMLNIAELFSDQQADVWKESIARRRRKGLPHANQGRFGYYRCDTCPPRKPGVPLETCPACKEGVLKVDPVLGPRLADAWRRVAAGEFIAHITHEWYADGVVDPVSGKPVTPGRLYDILDSGFGLGFVRYRLPEQQHVLRTGKDGVKRRGRNRSRRPETFGLYLPGGHEPVIEDRAECERLWDAYLARRGDTPKTSARERGDIRYSATGLVFCSACGGSMHALLRAKKIRKPPVDGRPDPFDVTWRCRRYAELGSCRGSGYGNLEHIEARVLDWLKDHAKGGQDMEARVRRSRPAPKRTDSATRIAVIERELERLVRQEAHRQPGGRLGQRGRRATQAGADRRPPREARDGTPAALQASGAHGFPAPCRGFQELGGGVGAGGPEHQEQADQDRRARDLRPQGPRAAAEREVQDRPHVGGAPRRGAGCAACGRRRAVELPRRVVFVRSPCTVRRGLLPGRHHS
ncbi:recombinase family protein [Streptomyces sp. NPDC056399]|uniref:recombinase family protein n=1 Tax=Streptomyces sp. NPDC056399 TaxID=3345807 RepID=UPI0035DE45C6